MKNKIRQEGNNNVSLIESPINVYNYNNFDAVSELQKLVASGQFKDASKLLKILFQGISSQHPAYPYWRYDFEYNNGGIIFKHVPNSIEALTTHPLHGEMKFILPEQYSNFKSINDLLKYSYGKQIKVDIDVLSVKMYAGNILIEEKEADEKNKITAIFEPSEFPPPIPMKLYLNDNSWSIDYLEMGLKEISDDYIVIDNSKQCCSKYDVSIIKFINADKGTINVKIREQFVSDVSANLILNKLIYLYNGSQLTLELLENNNIFMIAKNIGSKNVSKGIKSYLDILTDLVELEKYYKVKFILPIDRIDKQALKKIAILKMAMAGESVKGYYNNFSINIDTREFLKNILKYRKPEGSSMKLSLENDSDKTIDLFGVKIFFGKREIYFENAVLANAEKLERKLETMDDGETVIVELKPHIDKKGKFLDFYIEPVIRHC
jgi:hypothetical protein